MSDYAGDRGNRDAFFAALGRVFEEFRDVAGGYAVCDLTRLAAVTGHDLKSHVGASRVESGKLVTEFSLRSPGHQFPDDIDDCWAVVLNPTTDPPSWDCIMYLTS